MTVCRSRFRIWFMRMDTCEHNCRVRLQRPQTIAVSLCGVVGRACGLVSLEPTKGAEILKDHPSWFQDCRCLDILIVIPAGDGGQ
ncbi:hypothetical protein Q3G72_003608 [Acer saccharum]|nr:hypothetical protein Q3G72_003608 [Acer saccharum]